MKVLHVDSAREHRGGQAQLAYLVAGSDDALLLRPGSPLAARFPHARPYGHSGLHAAIRAERPDLIAAHTSHAHGLALLQRSTPVVVHRRVDFAPGPLSGPKYRAVRGFVAVSAAVAAVLERAVPASRVRVVHDGVAPRPGTALPRPAGPVVLAVGALVPHKDHVTLVRAAAIGGFTTWIAGEGPLRPALEAEIARIGAPVALLGQRDDIADLLATADVFCHPSREEGLGQAVLEARAAGCRIVATRAGGVPEIAGPDAALVDVRRPSALAAAVLDALARPRPRPSLPPGLHADTLRARTLAAYADLLGL
ncbi:MAG: glycosyltransferase [Alphaproteobacteria bacterium]|nr:glycosyltransferase [Alphaproteobacteria bacterium]